MGKWKAEVYHKGSSECAGYFACEEDAARARDALERKVKGSGATFFNLPDGRMAPAATKRKHEPMAEPRPSSLPPHKRMKREPTASFPSLSFSSSSSSSSSSTIPPASAEASADCMGLEPGDVELMHSLCKLVGEHSEMGSVLYFGRVMPPQEQQRLLAGAETPKATAQPKTARRAKSISPPIKPAAASTGKSAEKGERAPGRSRSHRPPVGQHLVARHGGARLRD